MPTTDFPTTPTYATLSAAEVAARTADLLERYRREDAERAARLAAILAL